MLKRTPVYPFLFIVYVILNPLLTNLGEIEPAQALRPFLLLLAFTAVLFLLFGLIFKNWQYAGYVTFLVLGFFALYGHLARILQNQFSVDIAKNQLWLTGIWSTILLGLGLKKTWLRFGGERTTGALNTFLGILLLVGFVSGAPNIPRAFAAPAVSESFSPADSAIQLDCANTPDIYYIILDAYGRADVLEELYGVDNSAFLAALEEKGFYIAEESHSNYLQSIFSIPSGLNFSYLDSEPENADAVQYFTGLTADNQLMRALKQCGYQTIAFETGFTFTNQPTVDVYLTSGSPITNFESLLLADSPLDWLPEAIYQASPPYSYEGHRERVLFSFEELKSIPGMPGPKMVFAHIIAPHPPFVFDADGTPIQPERSYSMNDGDDYRGDREEYRKGYAGQVEFVNRMLAETLDAILRRSSSPPVIILQGDHGPGGFLDWDSPAQTCLWERSSILNAYYLPGIDKNSLNPDMAPVNSFRVVLNEYFNADLELLPDRTYFTSHRLIRQIIEVTDEQDSKVNCP